MGAIGGKWGLTPFNFFLSKTNFSGLFNEILVRYRNFSGWQGKELEFFDRGNIPILHASRNDMQICIIICSRRLLRRESRRSLRSALSRRLAPEQGTSPDGSAVKLTACRPLRW
jgi:hypothetical protein